LQSPSINAHVYKLSFANSTMTAAHEVSAEREPINIAEKRQQYFDICKYQF